MNDSLGFWDCDKCDAVAIPPNVFSCPKCKSPRATEAVEDVDNRDLGFSAKPRSLRPIVKYIAIIAIVTFLVFMFMVVFRRPADLNDISKYWGSDSCQSEDIQV